MKNHGTILKLDVADDLAFPNAVEAALDAAHRRFTNGVPRDSLQPDVQFIACSSRGDVYMVHVTDPHSNETASIRLTQKGISAGDGIETLGKRSSDAGITDWGPN